MLIAVASLLFHETAPFEKCHSKYCTHRAVDARRLSPPRGFISCKYRGWGIWIGPDAGSPAVVSGMCNRNTVDGGRMQDRVYGFQKVSSWPFATRTSYWLRLLVPALHRFEVHSYVFSYWCKIMVYPYIITIMLRCCCHYDITDTGWCSIQLNMWVNYFNYTWSKD